ncbi:MAG: sigma-70 family RNA polymerase sigma factor [Hyphomicrobiales bacterium]|nr:sigma-70 family RNA polymerase sigma factor [Hyphomicrobiales bacterium]
MTGPQPSFGDQMVREIPYLRAIGISLSGSYSAADDLVQDTLVKAWSHSDSFTQGTNLRAWLVTILRNTYFSQYRKRSREVQDTDGIFAGQVSVRAEQDSRLQMNEVQQAMDKLAPEHKEILLLVGLAELSYEEAAEITNVAVGTVKSRLNRARARLAELLGLTETREIGADPLLASIATRSKEF